MVVGISFIARLSPFIKSCENYCFLLGKLKQPFYASGFCEITITPWATNVFGHRDLSRVMQKDKTINEIAR